jgi:hypothetical protein
MSAGINPYEDRCTVRVRAFLRNNGRQGRIDGPPTAGQDDYQELRMRPDRHDDFTLVGVYDPTGSYIPFFPFDLNGQEGIDGWFRRLEKQGFKITKLV